MNLTELFTLESACLSETAKRLHITNAPDPAAQLRMKELALNIIEPCYRHFGKIAWSSFFRCLTLNRALKSKDNSQHVTGEAVDLDMDIVMLRNWELFYFIRDHLEYDQLIWEFGDDHNPAWVHVSFRKGKNRKQALRSIKENGKTVYQLFKQVA